MSSVRCLQKKVFKRTSELSPAKYYQSRCSKLGGRHLGFAEEAADRNFVAHHARLLVVGTCFADGKQNIPLRG